MLQESQTFQGVLRKKKDKNKNMRIRVRKTETFIEKRAPANLNSVFLYPSFLFLIFRFQLD